MVRVDIKDIADLVGMKDKLYKMDMVYTALSRQIVKVDIMDMWTMVDMLEIVDEAVFLLLPPFSLKI